MRVLDVAVERDISDACNQTRHVHKAEVHIVAHEHADSIATLNTSIEHRQGEAFGVMPEAECRTTVSIVISPAPQRSVLRVQLAGFIKERRQCASENWFFSAFWRCVDAGVRSGSAHGLVKVTALGHSVHS